MTAVAVESKSSEAAAAKKRLAGFHDVHAEGKSYLADNMYIRSGYRVDYSLSHCFCSLFELHNETWNVWTHIIGSLIFAGLMYSAFNMEIPTHLWTYDDGTHPYFEPDNIMYIESGRHTLHLFARNVLSATQVHHALEYVVDTRYQEMLSKQLQVASVIFGHTIAQIPSLRRFHEILDSHAEGISHSVSEQLFHLHDELTILKARLEPSFDALSKSMPLKSVVGSYTQVHGMKQSLQARLDAFTLYLRQLDTNDYPSLQFVLQEFHGVTDSIKNGLHAISDVAPSKLAPMLVVGNWPIKVFIGSAVICLTLSSIYHLLWVQSAAASVVFIQLDYSGIILMIAGSFFPLIYYSFYCTPNLLYMYLGIISALAVACLVASVCTSNQAIRSGMFLSLGFFALVPIGHLVWKHGIWDDHIQIFVKPLVAMGVLYLVGATIYGTRFPERYFPGHFDVWGHSHQLWHICVVAAALIHYNSAMQHYEWRWQTGCAV
ncbi:hypothetical protein DYB37_006368 [Aphanomyces astaci]|uniref:Uncharacterized protein n=1 Tax=Aphanomyces astaci TaxID=112090 RepID=A0A396ZUM4_APHAT|nr:hypothetical protein DYB36_012380 [Aphanomyces astaci]RHY24344.1 hypothetical protein DYB25_011369 [Aphanomyces astaci]RHY38964.1 hypothetical protein DYB30_012109 [Aphanomyces astaci]RHY43425.1 hypothetical protein DYB38_011840 [Aphanomyces astaci]RHY92050.1 hypothetical protein DYB35_005808 [Aphanomyces astaci]